MLFTLMVIVSWGRTKTRKPKYEKGWVVREAEEGGYATAGDAPSSNLKDIGAKFFPFLRFGEDAMSSQPSRRTWQSQG
jgi:hypothetical protein